MKIIIERFDGKKKYESTYELRIDEVKGQTLLSLLQYIKRTQDITLNFTAACRMAICGACAVRVNGHSYLACDTKMEELLEEYENPESMRISPLNNFRVITDLVVDWEPSIENLRKVKPTITPKSEFSEKTGCVQTQADVDAIKKQWDCILCGCCASECNKLEADASDYMQPFVFTHAYRAADDSRSKDPMIHLKPAIANGLWNCVHCQECVDRCPKGISSFGDIESLRVMAMKKGLNEGMGPAHAEAFLLDMVEGDGRLNEIKLALRSEGVLANTTKLDIAYNLMKAGKMNPLHIFGGEKIEGHAELVKMVEAARKAEKEGTIK
ncbi:8-methylmenaquinol:fumarate reductase iron-sulfur subunit [Campylobacter californiensis]|nr:8-methylmenaquinol:fumarate reductase iron-sulfur subunit [Campylobacter sp. RM6914]QCD50308.1 methylmenaquinol:fumarate reductase, MfrB subunit [Campylobacter sp. RM6914]